MQLVSRTFPSIRAICAALKANIYSSLKVSAGGMLKQAAVAERQFSDSDQATKSQQLIHSLVVNAWGADEHCPTWQSQ